MKKWCLLLSFFLATNAFAATKNAYVNTDCAYDGDGTASTCAASAGAAGAYSSMDNAATGEHTANADLVTATTDLWVWLEGTTVDVVTTKWDNFVTDATYQLHLSVSPTKHHTGTFSTSRYRITTTNGYALSFCAQYGSISWLQVYSTCSSNNCGGITVNGSLCTTDISDGVIAITDNLILNMGTNATNTAAGIRIEGGAHSLSKVVVSRNILYEKTLSSNVNTVYLKVKTDGTIGVYSNTIYGGNNGIYFNNAGSTETCNMYNNLMYEQGNKSFQQAATCGTAFNHSNNLSDDANSPDVGLRSKTIVFASTILPDLHLRLSDTDAIGAGIDKSTDADFKLPGNATYLYDVDLQTRDSTPDIGADELWTLTTANVSSGSFFRQKGTASYLQFPVVDGNNRPFSGLTDVVCRLCFYSDVSGISSCDNSYYSIPESINAGNYTLRLLALELTSDYVYATCYSNSNPNVIPQTFEINTISDIRTSRGLLQSATASTARLAASETFANNSINKSSLCIVSGTGMGQCREIINYVASTTTATIYPSWTITPDATSSYSINYASSLINPNLTQVRN